MLRAHDILADHRRQRYSGQRVAQLRGVLEDLVSVCSHPAAAPGVLPDTGGDDGELPCAVRAVEVVGMAGFLGFLW